jgi:hypothetical protein
MSTILTSEVTAEELVRLVANQGSYDVEEGWPIQDDPGWFKIRIRSDENAVDLLLAEQETQGAAAEEGLSPATVWVLMIEHEHGTSVWVRRTSKAAREQLYQWVLQWWDEELPEKTMPRDKAVAVEEYFNSFANFRESYIIHRVLVE